MDMLDKRCNALKAPPYVISTDKCCKRHVKGWLERNPQWERHPELPKALQLKALQN